MLGAEPDRPAQPSLSPGATTSPGLGEIDVDAGTTLMRLRVADGYAGFGEIVGCGRTLVILIDIEQHHAIDQIALRHTTD
ncbi:hypothetical protein, partial [Propionibacterium acidifaciens]|uniref:hypothetical protein n=1 Tax=Propionibacterium acidifaciens TaxID=556499 RepID=UPI003611C227